MSDEIYVNIGTSFQQPYQGQGVAQGTTPIAQAQYIARRPVNVQTPFTYQNRQPADARQPSNAQTPYNANRQVPSIVQTVRNYTYQASAQQPYPYIANAQSPYIANARQPSIYQANTRNPFTYQRQGTSPVIATTRQPFTYARQGQEPYSFQQSYQNPYTGQGQQPYEFNDTGRQPSTYQRQGSEPYSFQQSYRVPSTYTHQVTGNYQVTYRHPTTYQHQQPAPYQHPTTVSQPYNTPVIVAQPYQHPSTAQQPSSVGARRPVEYTYPDPIVLGPFFSRVDTVNPGYGYNSSLNGFKGNGSPFAPVGSRPLGANGNPSDSGNNGWPQNPNIPWALNSGVHYSIFTPGTNPTGTVYIGHVYKGTPSGTYYDLTDESGGGPTGNVGVDIQYMKCTTNIGRPNEQTSTLSTSQGTSTGSPADHTWYWSVSVFGAGYYVASAYGTQKVEMY